MKSDSTGVLAGVRVLELGGIGPVLFAGMLLADHGADVIRIDRVEEHGQVPPHPVLYRRRRSITLDLKDPDATSDVFDIVEKVDAVIEGFRPGVAERLGVGPDLCVTRNPRIVYGRMTGWGQYGPLAQAAGHDINYLSIAGALGAMGQRDSHPPTPLNLIADMGGGGMMLAFGVVSGILKARQTGRGDIIDAAMTEGTALQMATIYGWLGTGKWLDERESNLLDGAAPYYRTYRTADGYFMAVGAIEPQFYQALLVGLGLTNDPLLQNQDDRTSWRAMSDRLAETFAMKTRVEWITIFEALDACVSPVLSVTEAGAHPQSKARGSFLTVENFMHPTPAPRFERSPAQHPIPAPTIGYHTAEVLSEFRISNESRQRVSSPRTP